MQKNTQEQSSTSARHFKQITHPMRQLIEKWHKEKVASAEIAQRLGVHRSTIYRELKRGKVTHINSQLEQYTTYSADFASDRHEENMTAKGPALKIGADHDLVQRFNHLVLKHKCSLYAARTLLIEQGVNVKVSIRTLYNYVHHHGFPLLPHQLIQGPRKPRKQGIRKRLSHNNLKGRSIEERPAHINNRSEVGHHEMDTVVGPPGSGKVLLVLTERVTRFEHIVLMPDKTAKSVCRALDRLERFYGSRFKDLFKSITCDNGCEFADSEGIAKSCRRKGDRTLLFYAHPYCASERGSNENANRLIRRFLPKGTNLSSLKQEDVDHLASWMNRYPRKILDGHSPLNLAKEYNFHFRKISA